MSRRVRTLTHSESCRKKAAEVIIVSDLKFDAHIKFLCRKAAQKLSDLYQINKSFT